jgi:hypothetical protein
VRDILSVELQVVASSQILKADGPMGSKLSIFPSPNFMGCAHEFAVNLMRINGTCLRLLHRFGHIMLNSPHGQIKTPKAQQYLSKDNKLLAGYKQKWDTQHI